MENIKAICRCDFDCTFGLFIKGDIYHGIEYLDDDLIMLGGVRFSRETFKYFFKRVFKYGK
jgi:hypothetical protein